MKSQSVRFWSKVEKTSTCWLWKGATAKGYGILRTSHHNENAHRVSWQLHFGPIPIGSEVCHKCDVRNCVRPSHLFLGTRSENLLDASRKGRLEGRNVGRGERHGSHKLTDKQVLEIRAAKGTHRAIAKAFGIGKSTVGGIKRGTAWKHLKKT